MATTASSPSTLKPALTYRDRWQLIGGERLYVFVRWLVILILAGLLMQGLNQEVWPVSLESKPVVLILWGYAAFSLIMTLILLIPPLHGLLNPACFIDLLILASLMLVNPDLNGLLFPIYLFPVIVLALRYGDMHGIMTGIIAAMVYTAGFLGWHMVFKGESAPLELADYVPFGLQLVGLLVVPWIANSMVEYWSADNRRRVAQAQEQVTQAKQETQAAREQMRTVFTVASTLAETLRGDKILESLFREGQKLVPYSAGVALLPTGKPGELSVVAGHGLALTDMAMKIIVTQGSTLRAALFPPPNPRLIPDIGQDADVQPITTLRASKATCVIPLCNGIQVYGLALFVRQDTTPFTDDQLGFLTALTNYATVALINQDLMAEVKKERLDMATAEEHARHWLARDIHDGLAQKLAAITMNVEFIKRLIKDNPEEAIRELDKLSDLYKRANYDVRTLLGELKPTTLETKGLPTALEEYVERIKPIHEHIEFVVEKKGVSGMTMSKEAKGTLFNIAQESINNALKYAEPKHIWLRMQRDGYRFIMVIEDDGKGFNVEESKERAKARGSHGLSNLSDRARMIDGVTEIVSEPGKGTMVRVTVPLEV